uniref:Serpin domain-containing protein n=1 Tax=Glossina pallidipes TaxID=7398 RepID=A0A1B0AEY0_GLOPL
MIQPVRIKPPLFTIAIFLESGRADGSTATELDQGLNLVTGDLNAMADLYHSVLSQYEKSDILKIANKIYVQKDYEVQDEYNKLLSEKFFSKAEEINFSSNVEAAKAINSWVALKTNNRIQDLISAGSLNSDTRLILLNAIHFKGIKVVLLSAPMMPEISERFTADHPFYYVIINRKRLELFKGSLGKF